MATTGSPRQVRRQWGEALYDGHLFVFSDVDSTAARFHGSSDGSVGPTGTETRKLNTLVTALFHTLGHLPEPHQAHRFV